MNQRRRPGVADRSATGTAGHEDVGRSAERPRDIPRQGWREILGRLPGELKEDHVSVLAAGVAFKALLAIFPAIIAAISTWGLVASPEQITDQLQDLTAQLPEEAATILEEQMSAVAAGGAGALSVAFAVSVLLALWSASSGVAGLMEGVNAAYGEVDERGFARKRGLALLLTVGAILFLLVTLALIAILPPALDALGLEGVGATLVRIAVWPLLAVLVMAALAVVYAVAPDRDRPQLRWATWGAVAAALLWLLGSALFTIYVENFGTFGETYGALAGIVVLMLWLYLSAFVVLLGAEINAEMELQTAADTTVGEPRPMGRRRAVAADNLPDAQRRRDTR